MKRRIGVVLLSTLACDDVLASEYQTALELYIERTETTPSGSDPAYTATQNFFGVATRHHFSPVDTRAVPLNEAAFLNRNSSVLVLEGLSTFEFDRGDYLREDIDRKVIGSGLSVYIPNTWLHASVFYRRAEIDRSVESHFSATLGITPIKGLMLSTAFEEDAAYAPNIHAKYVANLPDDQAINIEGYYSKSDEDGALAYYEIGCDYYFSDYTSAGLTINRVSDLNTYTFELNHFFSEAFALSLSYSIDNDPYFDRHGLSLGLKLRL